jgi:hypothetical protein
VPGIPRRVPWRRGCGRPGRRHGADSAGDEVAVRDRVPVAEEVPPAAAREATGASAPAAGGAGCARRRRRREERKDGVAESARECAVGLVELPGHPPPRATAAAAARHLGAGKASVAAEEASRWAGGEMKADPDSATPEGKYGGTGGILNEAAPAGREKKFYAAAPHAATA